MTATPKVIVTTSKLDALAEAIASKAGVTLPLTIDEMKLAVDSITTVTLQSKTATPSESSQTVEPDSGYDGVILHRCLHPAPIIGADDRTSGKDNNNDEKEVILCQMCRKSE